jgi:xylulokinase
MSACSLEGHGVKCGRVRLVGGGSKNLFWRRICADILQRPLIFPAEADSAALGGALQAAAAHTGAPDIAEFVASHAPELEPERMEPDESVAGVYEEARARHHALGKALFDP